jgi:hypothetical protein
VGIHRVTLHTWIRTGRVRAPKSRMWSPRHVAHVREVKRATYCRGRGRKPMATDSESTFEEASRGPGRSRMMHPERLVTERNQVLSALAFAWGEVGWDLLHATSPEDVARALAPLQQGPQQYRLNPFFRASRQRASGAVIRNTRRALTALEQRRSAVQNNMQVAKDEASRTEQPASNAAGTNVTAIKDEHARRSAKRDALAQEFQRLDDECRALRATFDDQVASYVLDQLLGFLTSSRQHARTPPNIATAIAGLPDYIPTYALQLCAKKAPLGWPHFVYRIFKLLADTWARLTERTHDQWKHALVAVLVSMPPQNPVRFEIEKDWLFLDRAMDRADFEVDDTDVVPFRVFASFQKQRLAARGHELTALAEIGTRQLKEWQRTFESETPKKPPIRLGETDIIP